MQSKQAGGRSMPAGTALTSRVILAAGASLLALQYLADIIELLTGEDPPGGDPAIAPSKD